MTTHHHPDADNLSDDDIRTCDHCAIYAHELTCTAPDCDCNITAADARRIYFAEMP